MRLVFRWKVWMLILLPLLAVSIYMMHYSIFHDAHHILNYFLIDFGFLPIDVLLVTIILHRLLIMHEKRSMVKKMNMVIGVFWSEVGIDLMRLCASCDTRRDEKKTWLVVKPQWNARMYKRAKDKLDAIPYSMSCDKQVFERAKKYLHEKRTFLLSLLGNPNLLEHELFTDLLWAVFHFTEELAHRHSVQHLPQADCEHLTGDMKRAYKFLLLQWVSYMQHLQKDYPYLFSLALRTNPFDEQASVEIS